MKKILAVGGAWLLPVLTFAQVGQYRPTGGISDLLVWFKNLLNALVPILIALAVVWFIWNVFQFVIKEGDDREKAKDAMIWGIVAIAVMVSVWGLVAVLTSTFGTKGVGIGDAAGNINNLLP
jgi:hypothetical protein